MNKELEAYYKIVELKDELEDIVYELPCCFDTTELDGDEESIVEKGLNALGIIKEKKVDTLWFTDSDNKSLSDYNDMMLDLMGAKRYKELTQEEFDLLKEVLS